MPSETNISQQTQRDLKTILETLDPRIHELNAARRLNEGRSSTSSAAATDRHERFAERHLLSGLRKEVASVQG